MNFPFSRGNRSNGTVADPPAPISTPRVPSVIPALVMARKSAPTKSSSITTPGMGDRPTLDRVPRVRDKHSNIESRSAWIDPTLPPPAIPIEDTELRRLQAILTRQGRDATAGWLSFLYNEQLLEAVRTAELRTREGYERVQRWNDRAMERNQEIEEALVKLVGEKEEALTEPHSFTLSRRQRADRAHQLAARHAGLAGVEYSPETPLDAAQQYRTRALREAGAVEDMAQAQGAEAEALHLLESQPEEPDIVRISPTRPDGTATENLWTGITIAFGVAAFVSLTTASGIADAQEIYSGAVIKDHLWAVVIWGLVCIGAAKALSMSLTWCGELAGASWFRKRGNKLGLWAGIAGAALCLISIPIDAAIHRSGFLKSAIALTANNGSTISTGDQTVYWLMAMFLIVGYVVGSFGVGVMKGWREAEFEIASQEHAAHLHQKRHMELQETLGNAKLRQKTAQGTIDASPFHLALAKEPTFQQLLRACNRAVALEHVAKRAEAELEAIQSRYDSQIEVLEGMRQEPKEALFDEDRLLIEEAVYSAHYQIQLFRSHLYHLIHEVELPWLLRCIRRWFWFWEPRRVYWGRI